MVLEFIAAVYNEEAEIIDLVNHVSPYVDTLCIANDGSTDNTSQLLYDDVRKNYRPPLFQKNLVHTGLPETVKYEALQMVRDGSWVLMLDADERFAPYVLEQIKDWLNDGMDIHGISNPITHVYFHQIEIIDGVAVREFQKAKLFKKEAIRFPLDNIHMDDQFIGDGLYKENWTVYHRKSSDKQKLREREYLSTYKNLLDEGKIDQGRYEWLKGLHHFER